MFYDIFSIFFELIIKYIKSSGENNPKFYKNIFYLLEEIIKKKKMTQIPNNDMKFFISLFTTSNCF